MARSADTYRYARRNRTLREERGVWPRVGARYEPYVQKPPSYDMNRFLKGGPLIRERKQPKTYEPNGEREVARRIRQMGGAS